MAYGGQVDASHMKEVFNKQVLTFIRLRRSYHENEKKNLLWMEEGNDEKSSSRSSPIQTIEEDGFQFQFNKKKNSYC